MLDWILLGGSDIQLGAVDFFAAEAEAEAGADACAGAGAGGVGFSVIQDVSLLPYSSPPYMFDVVIN